MAQTLRQLLDQDKALSLAFTIAVLRAVAETVTDERLGSAAAGTGTARKGGVSLLSLKPGTLGSIMKVLRDKINKGEIKLPDDMLPETALKNIETELKSSTDYSSRTVEQIITGLKEKNLLKPEPKAPVHRPLKPQFLLGLLAPPAPSFA
jgi:hypothetical protein